MTLKLVFCKFQNILITILIDFQLFNKNSKIDKLTLQKRILCF